MSYEDSWGFLQQYRPFRCHLCPDGTGEFSDISCGDPWYREPRDGEAGSSLVLVRTERGMKILQGAMREGYVQLTRVPDGLLEASQRNLLEKRRSVWGRILAMKAMLVPFPRMKGFHLFSNWLDGSLIPRREASSGRSKGSSCAATASLTGTGISPSDSAMNRYRIFSTDRIHSKNSIGNVVLLILLAGLFSCNSSVKTQSNQPPQPSRPRSSVSQNGITWTFDREYPAGQFYLGDWWVVGPVTIVSISPGWDGQRNGSMIDPDASADTQGYRAGLDVQYVDSLNVAARLPLTIDPGQGSKGVVSLISSIGLPSILSGGSHEGIRSAAVLTVVSGAPPSDAFRRTPGETRPSIAPPG